jgi:hypothetical protein
VSPDNLRYGGGVDATILNPIVALILVITGLLILFLPRSKALIPFLLTSFLIPADQVLVIAGLHFPLLRILIVFGIIRIFLIRMQGQGRMFSGGVNKIDKAMILLSLTTAAAGTLLFQTTQALIFQLGNLYSAFGAYFFLRCLIRDHDDVVRAIRAFAVIVAVLGGIMLFEQLAGGRNPYALLGGAKALYFAMDLGRDGKVRATGSFGTPILAGTFGAVLLPLFIGLWLSDRKQRGVAVLGILGATLMVGASHSSTPALGYLFGLLGLCLWPVRSMTRAIQWGIVITLVGLQMVMKAPVYHLITRFDFSGSSYHRYALIHQTVLHFREWWLIGTANNANWGWDMWDTANQYVATAVSGGLLSLILFVAIIVYGFKYLGKARQAATDKRQALFFWALGSALFAQTLSFLGISLWDQSELEWYVLLAFISAIAVHQAQAANGQIDNAVDQGIATADIQPAYLGWRGRRLGDCKSMREDRPVSLHRRHAREF